MGVGREVCISLENVRYKNMMQLKKINTVLFPVRYSDKYYSDALAAADFTKLGLMQALVLKFAEQSFNAYYSDICVGSIACRLDKEGEAVCVYIMTLGVLAPYRGLGIGTKMLNHVLDLCIKQNIREICLHVQTSNEDAINFYKKFGFEVYILKDFGIELVMPRSTSGFLEVLEQKRL
ncbi:putative 6-hydroxynicotinate 3-monooxygenase-like [Capsicum annuum]|nr:putative 6-hydroxynicotinate 3-monooxygenase-like [Capsicum annuum]